MKSKLITLLLVMLLLPLSTSALVQKTVKGISKYYDGTIFMLEANLDAKNNRIYEQRFSYYPSGELETFVNVFFDSQGRIILEEYYNTNAEGEPELSFSYGYTYMGNHEICHSVNIEGDISYNYYSYISSKPVQGGYFTPSDRLKREKSAYPDELYCSMMSENNLIVGYNYCREGFPFYENYDFLGRVTDRFIISDSQYCKEHLSYYDDTEIIASINKEDGLLHTYEQYQYDETGRMIEKDTYFVVEEYGYVPDCSVYYSYNENNRLFRVISQKLDLITNELVYDNAISYDYEEDGRLIQETYYVFADSSFSFVADKETSYTYDENLRLSNYVNYDIVGGERKAVDKTLYVYDGLDMHILDFPTAEAENPTVMTVVKMDEADRELYYAKFIANSDGSFEEEPNMAVVNEYDEAGNHTLFARYDSAVCVTKTVMAYDSKGRRTLFETHYYLETKGKMRGDRKIERSYTDDGAVAEEYYYTGFSDPEDEYWNFASSQIYDFGSSAMPMPTRRAAVLFGGKECIVVNDLQNSTMSVVNSGGMTVYCGKAKSIVVRPGLYIVKLDGKAQRVVVR